MHQNVTRPRMTVTALAGALGKLPRFLVLFGLLATECNKRHPSQPSIAASRAPASGTPSGLPSTPDAAASNSHLPACPCPGQKEPLQNLPLEKDSIYSVIVRFDERAQQWMPDPYPRIAYHYASRIDWEDLNKFGPLDPSLTLLFHGKALETKQWKVEGKHQWRSVSTLVVQCVCRL